MDTEIGNSLLLLHLLSPCYVVRIVPHNFEKLEKFSALSLSSGYRIHVFIAVIFLAEEIGYANLKHITQ